MRTKLFVLTLLCLALAGCTENQRARSWGGTATEQLPPNTKLVMATWKQDSLWILTRPMSSNDVAESYNFKESSSFGLVQGEVRIHETKTNQNK